MTAVYNKVKPDKTRMEKGIHKSPVLDQIIKKRSLVLIIASICIVILVANLASRETTILVGNLLYTPVTVFMAVSSYILLRKQRKIEDRDKGWILFFGSVIAWFLAKHTWMITELVLHSKTFPSAADFFYIGEYIIMGTFIFRMGWPLRRYIPFHTKLFATLIASVFLVPAVLMAYTGGNTDPVSLILSLAYPFMDGVLLWPGIIILTLPFRLESGKFWNMISVGIISLLIGDTMFSYATSIDTYYTGYPFEIFFYVAYIMFGFAALTRAKQSLVHAPVLEEVRQAFQEYASKSPFNTWKTLLVLSAGAVTTFVILGFWTDVIKHLTTNELDVLTPAGYAMSALIVIVLAVATLSMKRIHDLQLKIKNVQRGPCKDTGQAEMETLVNTCLHRIEKQKHRQNIMVPFSVALMVALVVISTYAITSTISDIETQNSTIPSGTYLIQDLKGSTINTGVAWNVSPNQPLMVTIVNSNLVKSDKLQAIKNAILSKDLTVIKNSQSGQTSSTGDAVYYDGWVGALENIHQQNSSLPIPTNFEVSQSDKAVGDIIIILSTDTDADGSLGFTKSIADEKNHQLLKSFITIFDVGDLSDNKIGDVTRHEFGHALGLGHTSDPNDLMNEQFHQNLAYISPCDVDALKSIYSGHMSTRFTCPQ